MSNAEHALAPIAAVPAEQQVMIMPPHVAAVVPFTHHERYEQLSFEQKQRISLLLALFSEMATAPEGVVAASNRIARIQTARGFSGSNLRTLYYNFRDAEKAAKGTGWLTLAKIYKGPTKLAPLFVQEVRRRIENNAVSARAAMTELKTEWAEGKSIPGYGTWREYFRATQPLEDVPERYPFNYFPPGWSESNLYDQQSSRAERALKRRGWAAAKRYLPHVMRDLSLLRFLELIVIDDFETDQNVLAWNPELKRWQICRCAGLVAIDAATRTKLAIGLKPRFTDDEGKKQSLTRADVQTLLYSVFLAWGLPTAYGCTILCENGGAAITDDFETALILILGVQVARTGLIHEKTLRNGFVQGGGKPWEKPWIESMFRLMHSTAGALPGQKGATYQLKPADLEAKVLYTEKLLNQDALAPEVAAQLKVPFLKTEEFLTAYERIFQRMEDRHDHKLQGFEQRFLFRLPGCAQLVDKRSLALLDSADVRMAVPEVIQESPRERRERLLADCQRVQVAPHILACLLLIPKKVKLSNHRLAFTHQGKGYTYADADSKVMKRAEGEELLAYFDQARPAVVHVMDLKGHYIGSVASRNRIDIRDTEALGAEQEAVSRLIHACVVGPVQERHQAESLEFAAADAENIRLQLAAGIVKPVRMTPEARTRGAQTLPAAAATPAAPVPSAQSTEASASYVPTVAKAPQRPATLTARLAQPVSSRDAFIGQQLAEGVSQEIGAADASRDRAAAVRAQAAALSPEDLQAFGSDPAAPLPTAPAPESRETLDDYL